MGLFDAIKGLLGGETAQSLLESTGLSEHVEGLIGEGGAVAESMGVDVGQAAEAMGVDVGAVTDSLPGGIEPPAGAI